jgi:membrane-associated protein
MITSILNYFEAIIFSLSLEHQLPSFLFLFFIVFIENGFFFLPFLPGDSLFFVAGAIFSGVSIGRISFLFLLLVIAAILGDLLNYSIGRFAGKKILQRHWINQVHFKRTEQYFANYGKKTVFFARFIPIIRCIAPLVAGIGKMNIRSFMIYNILGAISWVFIFLFGGYFFGNIPIIKDNLSYIIIAIVIFSVIPIIYYSYKEYRKIN